MKEVRLGGKKSTCYSFHLFKILKQPAVIESKSGVMWRMGGTDSQGHEGNFRGKYDQYLDCVDALIDAFIC